MFVALVNARDCEISSCAILKCLVRKQAIVEYKKRFNKMPDRILSTFCCGLKIQLSILTKLLAIT